MSCLLWIALLTGSLT